MLGVVSSEAKTSFDLGRTRRRVNDKKVLFCFDFEHKTTNEYAGELQAKQGFFYLSPVVGRFNA